jgi:5-bromo-4-chloroindolyl phosphate hydrolysis protein
LILKFISRTKNQQDVRTWETTQGTKVKKSIFYGLRQKPKKFYNSTNFGDSTFHTIYKRGNEN